MAVEQSEEEEKRVVEESEEDLKIPGSCKRSSRVTRFVMDVLKISSTFQEAHATRGVARMGCRIAATCNLQEQGGDHQSSHYHHNSSWTIPS